LGYAPNPKRAVIFQQTWTGRLVRGFHHILQGNRSTRFASDAKTDSITGAFIWQSKTSMRVSQIASFEFVVTGRVRLIARCVAFTTPRRSERQPHWKIGRASCRERV